MTTVPKASSSPHLDSEAAKETPETDRGAYVSRQSTVRLPLAGIWAGAGSWGPLQKEKRQRMRRTRASLEDQASHPFAYISRRHFQHT